MKTIIKNYLTKILAIVLTVILAIPSQIFAAATNNYSTDNTDQAKSIMSIDQDTQSPNVDPQATGEESSTLVSDITSNEVEDYTIEKSAYLSKTTGQINYKIIVRNKNQNESADQELKSTFAIANSTDLKELKVDKVTELDADNKEIELKYQEAHPGKLYSNDSFDTIAIKSSKSQNAVLYYLSAKLTDEALENIEDISPQMALEINIAQAEEGIYQDRYQLELGKEETSHTLVDVKENTHLIKGSYNKEKSKILGQKVDEILWTDYINPKDDKKFTYNIGLDDSQDTSKSEIKIEFYQATEKGFLLKEDYTKNIPFSSSLKLQIPQGYIAKLELNTRPKAKTNAKEYAFNGIKIQNPSYAEETSQAGEEEKPSEDDAEPLPANTSKEENSKTKEEDERQKTEESGKSAQSAIALNKDAYISDLKENNKLSTNLENATKKIVPVLESYNKEEINWNDFKASIQNIAKAENIDSGQAEEIISALLTGLNEDKYKVANVDIKEATNFDQASENALTTEEIKALIKSEFAKEKSGQITEKELEQTLATIREENNIDKEAFFNILVDLYKNAEIANDVEENPSEKEELPKIDTEKSKDQVLAEKLAEEDLSTEDFIAFLQSYVKSYDIKEDQLESLLKENQVEVEKVIGDFTIEEIVAAAYLEGLNPHIFAGTNTAILEADFSNEKFITELEYSAETLTRATNEDKFFEIVRSNSTDDLSDQEIRNDYVGWKINIPGTDNSGNDITEFKKDKYEYDNLNFSIYAPAGQSLEDYKVVVEDGQDGTTDYSGSMTEKEKKGEHYIYSFSIPKNKLTEKGYNIYVVAKEPKKRQNYAIGLKVSPDKNYVTELAENYKDKFEELKEKYPLLIKWMDTSDANPYRNGINLIDTRMIYSEPNGWQDLFPYNGFSSLDYNDNIDDTDIMKNRVSMFGNIKEDGQITWTISETFPAEKLVNKNTVGIDAYSAKTDGQELTGPSVQILVPDDNGGYEVTNLGEDVSIETLQAKIGNKPGTIVNYTYTNQAKNKDELTTLRLDSGKEASIANKPVLERDPGDITDTSGLKYLHKVQEHNDGPGYEIALSNDQAHTMKAFIPSKPSANPRYNDPKFNDTGVIVFCLNPGKPEPTRQYKFNGTITKGEWSTKEEDWVKNGRALAALATASEAKSSPLYNGKSDDAFYASLYEHILKMYWYGQELAEEYQLDEQSYYKIIQYNLYYWLTGENYAENFRNGGGYNPNYFSSAEYSYATGLKNRIAAGEGWEEVNYDEDIEIYYYGHDKTRSYQNTITGDTKRKAKKGSVTVNKIDQDGKKLPGAYFQLLDKNKDPIKTLVTDENGVAVFEDLDYGTYYIKEVQGPKGYQFKEEISDAIVVGEKQAYYTFNYKNKKNEIVFRKVNEKGLAMDGVVFELSLNGRALPGQEQTSDKNGKFSWKELTPGNYQVVEKDISKYPEYSENQGRTVASFRVDENNNIKDKKIYYPNSSSKDDIKNEKNEGKPIGIEFTKVDLKTDEALEGAEFVLEYRKKPDSSIFRELPGSRTRSNSQGKLVWNDLVDGDYRVIETKAPDGDNYNTGLNLGEKATFTIEKNQYGYYEIKNVTPSDLKITNTEKPEEPKDVFGEFEFTKVDSETKDKLQGVEFTLTSNDQVGLKNNKFDYKVSKTTDAEGKITYTKLYPGTYTLKETKQLPGYKENTETWKVVVAEDGTTKVYDEARNELTKKALNLTFLNNNNKVVTNKADYTFSLSKTDEDNIVDLNLTIEPQKTTNKATIYYVYDDDKNAKLLDELARSGTVAKIVPIKVNDKDEYKGHIQKAYLSNGLKNNPNGILVSYITNDYANQLTSEEIDLMVKGKQTDVDSTNKPLFAYYKITSKNLSKIYNTGAGSHGFYKAGFEDNPDFKELIDFINSGAINSTDKSINIQLKSDPAIGVVEGQKYFSINPFFHNGKYLIPGKATTIAKIKVNPELINPNSTVYVFEDIKIEDSRGSENIFYGSELPGIEVSKDFDSSQGSGSTSDFSISNDKEKPEPANLTIKKIDSETNEGLEGAKFELYRTKENAMSRTEIVDYATTNEHGYAIFDSPEIQTDTTYYVKEIAAPEGYKITSAITAVKSSATEDNTINAEIPNEKNNARFELYKKGSDGEYLKGVKFKLTNNTTKESVDLEETDGNGYLSYDKLKINTSYELEEISAAEGYTRNKDKATITVDKSGNVTVNKNNLAIAKEGEELGLVLVATNIKQPSIDFVKEDKSTGEKLYGAEFVLYKDDKEVTNSLTSSDADGKFGFDNLEDGSYTVYETVSPEGYPYLEDKLEVATFTVKDGKVTVIKTNQKYGNSETQNPDLSKPFVIYNSFNEIKFKKVNEYKEALKGAKFKLDRVWDSYDDSGKLQPHRDTLLDNIETPDDGIIALTATEPGRYQLVETYAPKGYQQIKTNNKEKGEIVAEFTVERGSLDIKNVLVGDNYIQDMTGKTDPLEIVNKEVGEGKFQVNKVKKDGNTTNPLTGAKFLLKDMESGQYVKTDGTLTTNSGSALTNGNATVDYENLPVGEYELREFKSPDGYVRTINTWTIKVEKGGQTSIKLKDDLDDDVDDEITNETTSSPAILKLENKSNKIEFTKIDSKTKKRLAGVQFEIWWDQQGNIENRYEDTGDTGDTKESQYKNYVKIKNPDGGTTFTTDADGKFKLSNLKTGHYKIYETKILDGYKVDDQPTDNEPIAKATGEFVNEFFVDIDGDIKKNDNGIVGGDKEEPITIIKNTPITGKFRVQKVGEDGVEKLDGAEFALYKVTNGNIDKENLIKPKAVKDADDKDIPGRIEFADLKKGQYLLEETKAPKGYVMSAAKWEVTVEDDGKLNISSDDESSYFTRTDDTLTLNVVNKKPTYPSTGGAGTFIGFALLGTAVMLAAIAYYGIYANNKNSRRS